MNDDRKYHTIGKYYYAFRRDFTDWLFGIAWCSTWVDFHFGPWNLEIWWW